MKYGYYLQVITVARYLMLISWWEHVAYRQPPLNCLSNHFANRCPPCLIMCDSRHYGHQILQYIISLLTFLLLPGWKQVSEWFRTDWPFILDNSSSTIPYFFVLKTTSVIIGNKKIEKGIVVYDYKSIVTSVRVTIGDNENWNWILIPRMFYKTEQRFFLIGLAERLNF